ncbi:TatD family hydrolase [Candidatus Fokinia crypta]|uniref:TatD family deoxyribonuclease n=1 Tax=Candidatus Fokinia crypta TaxID=1920990 RepID=A0ABZ0UPF8_9RICK|nr:TatD family hydrolase [Candidatus Fokinia cryptica]WPX98018.1 TatD family deoxyribonuclease [Candidatus Fokinia cryptica]
MYPRIFVDSHCHLNFDIFVGELPSLIESAHRAGVFLLNTISTKRSEWDDVCSMAEVNDSIFCTIGVHPLNVVEDNVTVCDFEKYLSHHKVIGIGEIGLDFHLSDVDKLKQISVFEHQLEVSVMHDLPVVIHQREAHNEMLEVLRRFKGKVRGVMHCFTGTYDMAISYIELGFYISFSGIITFNSADMLRECASKIPIDKILIETDSPYLAPVPYRGKVNSPANVIEVARKIGLIRKMSIEEVGKITTNNFFTLFGKKNKCEQFF